jgi:hypothetical protein
MIGEKFDATEIKLEELFKKGYHGRELTDKEKQLFVAIEKCKELMHPWCNDQDQITFILAVGTPPQGNVFGEKGFLSSTTAGHPETILTIINHMVDDVETELKSK